MSSIKWIELKLKEKFNRQDFCRQTTEFIPLKSTPNQIFTNSKGHNSTMTKLTWEKIASCTSTTTEWHLCQVSSGSGSKCRRSWMYKILQTDRPPARPTDRLIPVYPHKTNFGGIKNKFWGYNETTSHWDLLSVQTCGHS